MKNKYETPEAQILLLENVDTVLVSTGDDAFNEVYTPWQDIVSF